jgi:hypothetical protein
LIDARITANCWYANIAGRTRLIYARVAVNIADGTRLVNTRVESCCWHTDVTSPTWLVEPWITIRPNGAGIAGNAGLIDTAVTGNRRHRKGNYGNGNNQTHPCPG